MKSCSTCKENLPLTSFNKKSQTKDGLSGICKNCIKIISRRDYIKHSDKIKKRVKNFREVNPDYSKDYYKNNLDYFKKYNNNTSEKRKQWQRDNKTRISETRRIRWEKYPELKLKARLRSYYWFHLKKSKTEKTNSSIKLLGCSIQNFKSYLENKFQNGMSWENHGEWHLDHIKPCASFDLSDPVQLGACFHYTNFQPLWAKDNLKKGARY
jgi:hypothetical protein